MKRRTERYREEDSAGAAGPSPQRAMAGHTTRSYDLILIKSDFLEDNT